MADEPMSPTERESLLDRLVTLYLEEGEAGRRPDRQGWLARYPGVAAELAAFFAGQDRLERVTAPLRQVACAAGAAEETLDQFRAGNGRRGRPAPAGALAGRFGDYQLLEELGQGGGGVVYRARQLSVGREVAMKVVLAGRLASPAERDRFRTEAEVVAGLDHPNIVPLYEVGEHDGLPYFSMKLLPGGSLAQAIADGGWAGGRGRQRRAAGVLLKVARAVHHAHQRGVLHRDLKPANVLLDERGEPHVTDFGLAKRLEGQAQTHTGAIVGTPGYMAPEQARADKAAVTTASDVYGLGALLYALLAGRPPFQGPTVLETLLLVQSAEPEPPSRAQEGIDRELETICLKCLQKEPKRRYETAEALAEDLGRWLAGEPVRARPVGRAQRAWRWCRRNPGVAVPSGAALLLLLVCAVGASLAAWRLGDQLHQTRQAERDGKHQLFQSQLTQARASRHGGQAGRRFDGLKAVAEASRLARELDLGPEARLALRNEAIALMALVDLKPDSQWDCFPPGQMETGVAFDRDVQRYALVDDDGDIRVRRLADNRDLLRLPNAGGPPAARRKPQWCRFLYFSPDGHYLAAGASYDAEARPHETMPLQVWDARGGTLLWTGPPTPSHNYIRDVDFSPDSRVVAAPHLDGSIRLYDVPSGKELRSLSLGKPTVGPRFDPAGDRLAVCSGTQVHILDLAGRPLQPPLTHASPANLVSWSPDGRLLAAVDKGAEVTVWDVKAGKIQSVCNPRQVYAVDASFNERGDLLAITGGFGDVTTQFWDPRTGKEVFRTEGSASSLSRGDRWLGFGIFGSSVGRWEVAGGAEYRTLAGHAPGSQGFLRVSPDGRLLAEASKDRIWLWDLAAGKAVAGLPAGKPSYSNGILFDHRGRFLITSSEAGLYRWPLRAGSGARTAHLQIGPPQRLHVPGGGRPWAASICGEGRVLVVLFSGHRIVFFDLERMEVTRILPAGSPISWLAISPDAKYVSAGGHFVSLGSVVWDAATGERVFALPGLAEGALLFSPDNRWLTFSTRQAYFFYEVGTWRPGPVVKREYVGPGRGVPLAFSPDGKVAAIAHTPRAVRLIEPATGREIATLTAPSPGQVISLCFAPDGGLAVATGDGVIQLWDLRRIRAQLRPLGLDWEPPLGKPARAEDPKPLRVEVDPGELIERGKSNLFGRGADVEP